MKSLFKVYTAVPICLVYLLSRMVYAIKIRISNSNYNFVFVVHGLFSTLVGVLYTIQRPTVVY